MTNEARQGAVSASSERRNQIAHEMQTLLMGHVISKSTDRSSGPTRNTTSSYTDAVRFDAEKRKIFRTLPLLAALTRDLPKPGDKMLFEDAGPPIVILRAKDGGIRAYLNMCPHRAAKVVEVCRSGSRITCPFHGWTFDLEGKLIGQPSAQSFDNIDRQELGLIRIPAVERHGLIFVRADPEATSIDIDSYLGDFAPELELLEFARAKPIKRGRIEAGTNWKYALDTYGESYHLSTLHPDTVGKAAVNDTMIYQPFPPHHRIGYAPISMLDDTRKPSTEWPKRPFSAVHLLFPNTIVHVTALGPGHTYLFYRVFPGRSAAQSFTMMETYRSGEVPESDDVAPWEAMHDYQVRVIGTEDYRAASAAQTNLAYAPDGHTLVYGANELSIQNFEQYVSNLIYDADDDLVGDSPACDQYAASSII